MWESEVCSFQCSGSLWSVEIHTGFVYLFVCGWLTFELRYLPRGALGQTFMADVTGQSHRHATAPQQKPDLLTASVLHTEQQTEHP